MINFLNELKTKNELLFWLNAFLFILTFIYYVLTKVSLRKIDGVNVWFKPFKFAASSVLYLSAIVWYCRYIPNFNTELFSRANIVFFVFENGYIAIQAARGQASHFNLSTKLYASLYSLMALAATGITLGATFILMKFFESDFPELSKSYLWSIRFSLMIFILFSFQGFLMGGRLTHTVGGNNDMNTLPIVKWNTTKGDLRVAHFIGMHSLQVLPLISYYVIPNLIGVIIFSFAYFLLATFVLFQALQGKPFIKVNI